MVTCQILTKVISGSDSLMSLQVYRQERILIVCDDFLKKNGMVDFVLHQLEQSNKVVIFSGVQPDPSLSIVAKVLVEILRLQPTIIIGFGGGSSIDTVKGAIYFALHSKIIGQKPSFIAIPTTSGTGSEMTSFAVISDPEEQRKIAIIENSMYADIAILDPHLTLSVPPSITANTGFDVLTHALEAYVAKASTSFTEGLAYKVIDLVMKHFITSYQNGNNMLAREKMAEASNMAGIAFNMAGLGVVHSMAHQLGSVFHIPHGMACAIALPIGIQFNSKHGGTAEKYAEIVYQLGLAPRTMKTIDAVQVLCSTICQLREKTGVVPGISAISNCITLEGYLKEIPQMIEHALKDSCLTGNPIPVQATDFADLFHWAY
ncbi:alcohol dehydrogenase [Veillonellaceae bacterium M2-8]|nr:alcohol dehydrogenase [Veillonellaceae bacterium M2-8]